MVWRARACRTAELETIKPGSEHAIATTHFPPRTDPSWLKGAEAKPVRAELEDDLAAVGAIAAVDLERRADALVEAAFADDEAGGLGLGVPAGTAQLALAYFRDAASTIVELIRAVPALASRIDEGSRPSPPPRTTTFGEMTVAEEGGARGGRGGAFAAAARRGALAATADRIARETIPMIETSAEAFAAGTGGEDDGSAGGAVAVACAAAASAMETLLRVMRDPPPSPADEGEDLAEYVDGDRVDDDDDVDASMRGKIESLRALFPDQYGDGYLALALDAFGGDPESAAGALLEGDLPAALRGIDATSTLAAYRETKTKTKTKTEEGATGRTGPTPVAAPAALSGPWASRPRAQPASFPGVSGDDVRGGFIRRKGDNRDRAGYRTWDLRTTADDRAATLARCAELEYDDEYDDSFDELAEVANVGSTAGEVSEGPPAGSSGASGRSNVDSRNGDSRGDKAYWIAHGKVYHSKKEGATRIRAGGVEEAARLAAAQLAAARDEVHGLGAGGNRAAFDARAAHRGGTAPTLIGPIPDAHSSSWQPPERLRAKASSMQGSSSWLSGAPSRCPASRRSPHATPRQSGRGSHSESCDRWALSAAPSALSSAPPSTGASVPVSLTTPAPPSSFRWLRRKS